MTATVPVRDNPNWRSRSCACRPNPPCYGEPVDDYDFEWTITWWRWIFGLALLWTAWLAWSDGIDTDDLLIELLGLVLVFGVCVLIVTVVVWLCRFFLLLALLAWSFIKELLGFGS